MPTIAENRARNAGPSNPAGDTPCETVSIAMRDGVRLSADIYLPETDRDWEDGGWPVLLERTPYGKRGLSRSERTSRNPEGLTRSQVALELADHGFVVVVQDCRGRYESEGEFTKYVNEAEDGFDTISWLVDQPWCNGKVGTYGISYSAHTQIAAACLNPPGLASMFLDSGGFSSAYHGGIRRGGTFELKQATWAYKHALLSPATASDPERREALERVNLHEWFAKMPWRPGESPLSAAPEYEEYLFEQWTRGEYSDYWKQLGLSALGRYAEMPDVPVMILNSWYDPYVGTSVANYSHLRDTKRSAVFLTMGPWMHGQRSRSYSGDVDFGPSAVFESHFGRTYLDYRADWFDWTLRNGRSRRTFDARNPVSVFTMGGGSASRTDGQRLDHGGEWRKLHDWPSPNASDTTLYISDESLSEEKTNGCAAPAEYRYDPKRPTPSIGGPITSGAPLMFGGAYDQREREDFFGCEVTGRALRDRDDVISFETAPLKKDVTVLGAPEAVLWVSSDCADTDFVVRLIDVYPPSEDNPDGFAMNVTDGVIRARYRDGSPENLVPGRRYQIRIPMYDTANTFAKGHRIRLDIASSCFPQFDINPNTGEPEGSWTKTNVATNRIYRDVDGPSHIVLPLG